MKLRLFIAIITLAISPYLSAMQAPSWAANMWQWSQKQKELRKTVKEIVRNGSTIQEIETRRLKDQRNDAMEVYKYCLGITPQEWGIFKQKFESIKQNNPLMLPSRSPISEKAIIHPTIALIRRKLRERNLNPDAVEIELSNEYTAHQALLKNGTILNAITVETNNSNRDDEECAIDHEITHLQEHHAIEKSVLSDILLQRKDDPYKEQFILKQNECTALFNNLRYIHELEADALYPLQNYDAAKKARDQWKNQVEYRFLPNYEHPIRDLENFDLHPIIDLKLWDAIHTLKKSEWEHHPSYHDRYKQLDRIVTMLRMESSIRQNQEEKATLGARLWKTLKRAFDVFNPASNC